MVVAQEGRDPVLEDLRTLAIVFKLRRKVWLTWVLVAINILMYGLLILVETRLFPGKVPSFAPDFVLLMVGAKDNTLVMGGEVWRLLSCVFLHAGILHLVMNSMAIFVIGRMVENILGKGRMLIIYLVSGGAASVMSFLVTDNPSVGASGAIFGLLGAVGVFGVRNRKQIPSSLKRFLVTSPLFWIVANLGLGAAIPAIDNAAHVGGLLAGAGLAAVMGNDILPVRGKRAVTASRPLDMARLLGAVALSVVAAACVGMGVYNSLGGVSVPTPSVATATVVGRTIAYPPDWRRGTLVERSCSLETPDFPVGEGLPAEGECFVGPYHAMFFIEQADQPLIEALGPIASKPGVVHYVEHGGLSHYITLGYDSVVRQLTIPTPVAKAFEPVAAAMVGRENVEAGDGG